MDQWIVKAGTETVTVTAHRAEVTPCGALRFSNNSGEVVEIFACGAWSHVKAKKPAATASSVLG